MKKFLALLCIFVLVLTVCGCNNAEDSKSKTTSAEGKASMGEFDTSATINEAVIYEENDVKITANKLTYTNSAAELKLTFDNNTDKDLSFICGSANYDIISVNEVMAADGYIRCDIPAGESATDTMSFAFSDLKAYGVTCIADIITGFSISDEDYDINIQTGPLQIKTSLYDSYDYSINRYKEIMESGKFEKEFECVVNHFNSKEICNNSGVKISSVAVSTNKSETPVLMLEIDNQTNERMYFKIKEVSVNNNLVYESLWTTNSITPGKKYVEAFSLSNLANKYEGDFNDVSEISDISFTFEVGKTFNDTIDTQTVNISLPKIKVSKSN